MSCLSHMDHNFKGCVHQDYLYWEEFHLKPALVVDSCQFLAWNQMGAILLSLKD